MFDGSASNKAATADAAAAMASYRLRWFGPMTVAKSLPRYSVTISPICFAWPTAFFIM